MNPYNEVLKMLDRRTKPITDDYWARWFRLEWNAARRMVLGEERWIALQNKQSKNEEKEDGQAAGGKNT